jgi:uncharacterized membrane protein SpoIIM required for sporulation
MKFDLVLVRICCRSFFLLAEIGSRSFDFIFGFAFTQRFYALLPHGQFNLPFFFLFFLSGFLFGKQSINSTNYQRTTVRQKRRHCKG